MGPTIDRAKGEFCLDGGEHQQEGPRWVLFSMRHSKSSTIIDYHSWIVITNKDPAGFGSVHGGAACSYALVGCWRAANEGPGHRVSPLQKKGQFFLLRV